MNGGALLLCLFFFFTALVVIPSGKATLNCAMSTSGGCVGTSIKLLGIQNDTGGYNNAHAQNATYGTYNNALCCNATGYLAADLYAFCGSGSTTWLHLSNESNAHIEQVNESTYSVNACLRIVGATVTVTYADTSCTTNYDCIGSMESTVQGSNSTNAHIGDCSAYTRKICGNISSAVPTQANPILNATDYPANKTDANITCYNQSTSDPDGDAVTNTFTWKVNGVSYTAVSYPFNTNESTTTVGGVRDYTGGYNGTLGNGSTSSAPQWISQGRVGGAYIFDGNDDFIEIADNDALDITGNITLLAWINKTTAINGMVVSKYLVSSDGFPYEMSVNAAGRVRFFSDNGTTSNSYTSADSITLNAWTQIAVVVQGGQITSYINSVQDSSGWASYDPAIALPSDGPLRIGARSNVSTHFNGTIDEVLLFNRTLSQSQIAQLYSEASTGLNASTIVTAETTKGDNWTCSITPNDRIYDGTTLLSNDLVIRGSVPNAPTLTRPLNNNNTVTSRYPTFNWTVTDNDSDMITSYWNLTSAAGCAALPEHSVATTYYTSVDKLCVDHVYNWSVYACDVDGCGARASQFNFTIPSVVGLTLTTASVNFGTLQPSIPTQNNTNTTLGNSPPPFVFNNTGNVDIVATIKANAALWNSQALSTSYFQYADENSSSWANMTSGYTALTSNATVYASHEVELKIWAPQGETPGAKNTTISVLGASNE